MLRPPRQQFGWRVTTVTTGVKDPPTNVIASLTKAQPTLKRYSRPPGCSKCCFNLKNLSGFGSCKTDLEKRLRNASKHQSESQFHSWHLRVDDYIQSV